MTIERESTKKLCPKCNLQGIKSILSLCQINDEEALLMCKNVECTYAPFLTNLESHIVKRDLDQLTVRKRKLSISSSASSVSSYCSFSTDCGYNSTVRSASIRSLDAENCLKRIDKLGGLAPSKNYLLLPPPTPEVSERKSLVPFLVPAGHAHNFYSFQTSKIERLKKKQLADTKSDPISKLNFVNSTHTDIKNNTPQVSAFDSWKFPSPSACDSGIFKAKKTNLIAYPCSKLLSGVLKQRVIQDREAKTKHLDIRPVGLLEDFLKGYSPDANSVAPTSESGKSHIAAINAQLFKKFSHVPPDLTEINNKALGGDGVKEQKTLKLDEIYGDEKCGLESLFLNNQEELKQVTELGEFYINNFEDF